MLPFKKRYGLILAGLALFGFSYFTVLARFETNLLVKNWLSIFPLQVLAFIYVIYVINRGKQPY
jgi:hypothetical protein